MYQILDAYRARIKVEWSGRKSTRITRAPPNVYVPFVYVINVFRLFVRKEMLLIDRNDIFFFFMTRRYTPSFSVFNYLI